MYMYTCRYINIYITYVYTLYTYICIHEYVCVYMNMYVYTCRYINIYIRMWPSKEWTTYVYTTVQVGQQGGTTAKGGGATHQPLRLREVSAVARQLHWRLVLLAESPVMSPAAWVYMRRQLSRPLYRSRRWSQPMYMAPMLHKYTWVITCHNLRVKDHKPLVLAGAVAYHVLSLHEYMWSSTITAIIQESWLSQCVYMSHERPQLHGYIRIINYHSLYIGVMNYFNLCIWVTNVPSCMGIYASSTITAFI